MRNRRSLRIRMRSERVEQMPMRDARQSLTERHVRYREILSSGVILHERHHPRQHHRPLTRRVIHDLRTGHAQQTADRRAEHVVLVHPLTHVNGVLTTITVSVRDGYVETSLTTSGLQRNLASEPPNTHKAQLGADAPHNHDVE